MEVKRKQKGMCPFCKEIVTPIILEENTIRRDKCECPSCKEPIYLCRVPGCHDFAKGTTVYDHELCPDCTEKIEDAAKTGGKVAGDVVAAIITAVVLGKLGLKKKF